MRDAAAYKIDAREAVIEENRFVRCKLAFVTVTVLSRVAEGKGV